jgi:pimeloyl-ACP methyl ester carboxylesterase
VPSAKQALRVAGGPSLEARLLLPPKPRGLVILAPPEPLADVPPDAPPPELAELQQLGLALLQCDPLRGPAPDLARLAHQLVEAIDWCHRQRRLAHLPLGLQAARRVSAAALEAAAERPEAVAAVVSWAGRPDLAFEALGRVVSPTLLIVGARDVDLGELNAWAAAHLLAPHDLRVVPGAAATCRDPAARALVCAHTCDWFRSHLHPR